MRAFLAIGIGVALAACSKQDARNQGALANDKAAALGESGDYYTDLPLNEFMPHVMQYTADGIWKRQGYVTDVTGEHSLFPKTDAEWELAESAGLSLAELTNVLLIPGRRIDEPAWTKAVLDVRAIALKAAKAAERKDSDAFFAAGGELDEACDACHKRYDPSFRK